MPATLVATPDPEDGDPVRQPWERETTRCPRCRTSSAAAFGARYICGQCGNQWQVTSTELPAVEPDDLGSASVTTGRLRTFLARPQNAAERAEARRRLDRLAERTWSS